MATAAWGIEVAHNCSMGIEVTRNKKADLGGEGEKLTCLNPMSLATVDVVDHERETSHLHLKCQRLHVVSAVDRGDGSMKTDGAPHQRLTTPQVPSVAWRK